MQIVVEHAGIERELELLVDDPDVTVGGFLDALPLPGADAAGIILDGRWFPGELALADVHLHEGALVSLAAGPARADAPDRGPHLCVVGGPDAGRRVPLGGRTASLGRHPGCTVRLVDPTVSEWHAELEPGAHGAWLVRDLGSTNGTWVDEVAVTRDRSVCPDATVRLGAAQLRVRSHGTEDRPLGMDRRHRALGGLVPFNRPPRAAPPSGPEPISLPAEPAPSRARRALSLVSVAAPIVLGGALVTLTGNWRFALFLLVSPVVAVGNWVSARHQARKEDATSSRAFRRALADLDRDLAAAAAGERARRELLLPDLAEVTRRAHLPSSKLWQRRPLHDDFLRLRAGLGDVTWWPPIGTAPAARERPSDPVQDLVDRHGHLRGAPVEVDLSNGGVVGIVGDRSAAVALVRSLVCQAATHHGPADLGVAVLTREDRVRDWDWAKWLPHVRDPTGAGRWLAGARREADALLARLTAHERGGRTGGSRFGADDPPEGRHVLVVLDDVALTQGRRAPARLLLRGDHHPTAGIVIAETADQLPAVTSTVVELCSELGDAERHLPREDRGAVRFVIGGCTDDTARRLARALARYEDPELELVGASLPQSVRLLPLLGMDDIDEAAVLAGWRQGLPDPGVPSPIGLGEDGVVHVNLATDGPHALIGGTTGSGKSELLRSMVAGMAAQVDPHHLVFVLVDYKGGSAFDRCAELPHTVGMVTDLDGHLGERALRSLEAELHHRERRLRQAGAQDLLDYLRAGSPLGPLPRLVVVIDEFATLATELPDLLGALVGIAQRGRSLGVHLILATQRPSGSVDANIKANTNLRIALRVQDAADSVDILDRKDAAELSRTSPPGRAYIRFGPGEVTPVQVALTTAVAPPERRTAVRFGPVPFAPRPSPIDADEDAAGNPSDLDRLVSAVNAAFERSGLVAPRRPWLEMLPDQLDLAGLAEHADRTDVALGGHTAERTDAAVGGGAADPADRAAGVASSRVVLGLADDPDRQRRVPHCWEPAEGHLGIFGMVGSGTTTALLTLAIALADRFGPDELHLYVLDLGAGALAELLQLPHVGAVVAATDAELRDKLLRRLRSELDRRRTLAPTELANQPRLVVMIDGIGALLAEFDGPEGLEMGETFRRLFSDGPTVGIAFAVTGDRIGALPSRYHATIASRLLLRHADPQEFAAIGLRSRALPAFVPGRAVDAASHRIVQLARPGTVADAVERLADRWRDATGGPPPVRPLARVVAARDLPPGRCEGDVLRLPVGLAEEDLVPVTVDLHPTDHALVAGPPRSGKSELLVLLAQQVRAADPDAVLVGLCSQRSVLYGADPLDAAGAVSDLANVLGSVADDPRRWVLLIDDAPAVTDTDGILSALLHARRPRAHVIAAGRPDDLRAGFAHWTRHLRQTPAGVVLQPNLASDGELFGVRLPRRVPVAMNLPGRGFVTQDGAATLIQAATWTAGGRPGRSERPPDLPPTAREGHR